jgi:hypothetical protein
MALNKKIADLLNQAISFEKLATFSDRQNFLKAISQQTFTDSVFDRDPIVGTPPTKAPVKMTLPETVISNQPEPGLPEHATLPETVISEYPRIDPKQQEALSKIVSIEGLGLPLAVDGKLGPKTRQALQAFKKHFGYTNLSDQSALQAVVLRAQDPKYELTHGPSINPNKHTQNKPAI